MVIGEFKRTTRKGKNKIKGLTQAEINFIP
jgi:hypothetical protein